MVLTVKDLYQLQIAMKLDEYKYTKNTQLYFESMPYIGLVDSQVEFINQYITILEYKNDQTKQDFSEILNSIKSDNAKYQELLANGSKSTLIKKYARITAYLIRQMEKYDKMY